MNNTQPLFIELHSAGTEGLINAWDIAGVTPYTDMVTHVYVNYREKPFCVDESYEEIKRKLNNVAWIIK